MKPNPSASIYQQDPSYHTVSLEDNVDPADKNSPSLLPLSDDSKSQEHNRDVKFPNERLDPFKIAADVASILFPTALLTFVIIISQLDGDEVQETDLSAWRDAVNWLATIFPIMFASIVGRLMYEIARWRLEVGSTLELLEQLLGSRTVGSAVVSQFNFRPSVLSISLLLIWLFSPLGTQSMLRMLHSRLDIREFTSNVTQYDNLHETPFAHFEDSMPSALEPVATHLEYLSLLFTATLLTPQSTKMDTMDQWGNVKVPFLSPRGDANSSAWQAVGEPSLEGYTSLMGIPIANVPLGNTTLSFESMYIELDCPNVTSVSYDEEHGLDVDFDWGWDFTRSHVNYGREMPPENGTWQGMIDTNGSDTTGFNLALNNFIDYNWINQTVREAGDSPQWSPRPGQPDEYGPMRFIHEQGIQVYATQLALIADFHHTYGGPGTEFTAICNVRQRYVESRVFCEREQPGFRNCTVTAQRPSQKPHATELISHLNFPRVWAWVTDMLPRAGNRATGLMRGDAMQFLSRRPDIVLQYLADPSLTNITLNNMLLFEDVNKDLFSRRLSQVINTYLLLSQVHLSSMGGSLGESPLLSNVTHDVLHTTFVDVYLVSRSWVLVCAVACSIMLIGGILSAVFRQMATGPDVLGYASTVIRDSKYMELPPSSDRIGSLEIAKALRKQRVRYGYSSRELTGEPAAGVGLEDEIQRIR